MASAAVDRSRAAEQGRLPTPPWAREGRKPKAPARAPLTQEAIVDAALRVLDAEGYEGLSMRRVASELGTGAASLYAHVANKDELLLLMIDRVSAEYEFPEPDPEIWLEQLRDIVREQRRIFQAHPGIARAILGRIPFGPNSLRAMEGYLAVANAGNLPDRVLGWCADAISLYVTAQVFEEDIRRAGDPDITTDADIDTWLAQMRAYIRSLPPDEFPLLIDKVDAIFEHGGPDGRFDFGLDLMLRGLASFSGLPNDAPEVLAFTESAVKRNAEN